MGSALAAKRLLLEGAITEVKTFSYPSGHISLSLSHVHVTKVGASLLPSHSVQKDEGYAGPVYEISALPVTSGQDWSKLVGREDALSCCYLCCYRSVGRDYFSKPGSFYEH